MTHRMIRHDAEEFAGAFYEQDRSEMFRARWPNQMQYVRSAWPHFVKHVRAAYADMLTRHDVTEDMKEKIYTALLAEGGKSRLPSAAEPLQIDPDTEVFAGDKADNKYIEQNFGKAPSRKDLMNSAADLSSKLH